jgi:hypothetical protein
VGNLATAAQVQAFKTLGTDSGAATRLAACLAAASEWLGGEHGEIGFPLALTTGSVRLNGSGSRVLSFKFWPIVSVSNLLVCGQSWSVLTESGADTQQDAFLPNDSSKLFARYRPFPSGIANVSATVTRGIVDTTSETTIQNTSPADVVQVVVMLTHLLMIESVRIGEGSLTLGPEQVQTVARQARADYEFIDKLIVRYGLKVM